ncbi:thiosulfate transmembrane transporter [Aureococcus anophagefferens]|nr:thiosulfate transmembrane transporter [Aureococcus anophagefferens]
MAARTEAWRRNANIGASCLTGSAVIALTNPLDCLKSRFQVAPHSGGGVAAFARALVAGDGLWRGLWRPGLATNVCACTISVGTRIGLYPTLRDSFAPARGRRSSCTRASRAARWATASPRLYATRVAHVRDLGPASRRSGASGAGVGRSGGRAARAGAVMSGTQLATYDSAKGFAVDRGCWTTGPRYIAPRRCAPVSLTTAMVPPTWR